MAIEVARQRIKKLIESGSVSLSLNALQLTDRDLDEIFKNNEILFVNLHYLYLHNNRLRSIPFSKLKSLRAISLCNNRLDKIPDEILDLKELQYLFIDEIQLINSVETISKLEHLKITVWNGTKDVRSYSAFLEKAQKLFNFNSNRIKRLEQEITELEESIKLQAEVDKYLDNLSLKLARFLEVAFLILVIYLISANSDWVRENWQLLEPEVQVFSAYMAAILAVFTIVLNRTIWNWIDELVKEIVKKIIFLLSGFEIEKYKEVKSELEKAHKQKSYLIEQKPLADDADFPSILLSSISSRKKN